VPPGSPVIAWDAETGEYRRVEGLDGFTTWAEADEASRFLVGRLRVAEPGSGSGWLGRRAVAFESNEDHRPYHRTHYDKQPGLSSSSRISPSDVGHRQSHRLRA